MEFVEGDGGVGQADSDPFREGLRHVGADFGDGHGIAAVGFKVVSENRDGRGILTRGGEQHLALLQIHEKGYILTPSGGGFVDADLGDGRMVGFRACRVDVVGDDTPNQGVVLVDKAGHREDRHRLGEHHDQRLEQQRETAVRSGPGNGHAVDTTTRTLDARGAGVEKGLVLEKVQVPPSQLLGVVGLAGNSASRAGKDAASRKIQMDIQTTGRLLKGTAADQPGREQSQGGLKQLILVHRGRLPTRPSIVTQAHQGGRTRMPSETDLLPGHPNRRGRGFKTKTAL